MAISASLARYVEIQETHRKWSFKKELCPRWFYIQLLSCSHLKRQMGPNQYIFLEKLDKD